MAADTLVPDSLALSKPQAETLLREHYGLNPKSLVKLDSELSSVYRVELDTGNDAGAVVAFKATRFSPDAHALYRWRVTAMDHLQSLGIPTGATYPNLNGQAVTTADTPLGPVDAHVGEWLPGEMLDAVAPTRKVLRSAGQTAARVSTALADCPRPPAPFSHPWELKRTLDSLTSAMSTVQDRGTLRLLSEAAERFGKTVAPRLATLPESVVHHDLHDGNLLIDTSRQAVSGVLDFGDMVWGPRVAELAVTAGYACRGAADPVTAYLDVVEGWGQLTTLEADESTVLLAASIGRLAVNLGVWTARMDSDRSDYARSRSATSEHALRALLDADERQMNAMIRERLS